MFALILKNRVVDIVNTTFPVHNSMVWVDVPPGVEVGYEYVNNTFIAPIKPKVNYLEKRESEYPTHRELIVALWEKLVENRPQVADALQTKRQSIKTKYIPGVEYD